MKTYSIQHPYETGPGVGEIQKLVGVQVDDVYGVNTGNAVYKWKVKLGYAKPDHSAGAEFVAYMTGAKKPTAAMIKRAGKQPKLPTDGSSGAPTSLPTHEDVVRKNVVDVWHHLFSNYSKVHYPPHDVRQRSNIHLISTMQQLDEVLNSPGGLIADCSQTVSMVCHIAGAKCPDGDYAKDWAADGYTGTILDGTERITTSQVRVGDIYVYGGGTGHHTAQCIAILPNDFEMGSHGSDPVHEILQSVELDYQPSGGSWRRLTI